MVFDKSRWHVALVPALRNLGKRIKKKGKRRKGERAEKALLNEK